MEGKLLSSFNQMCDPCNVIPLLSIYYINQLLQVLCIQFVICGVLLWFGLG